jgi:hypothetical protein
MPGASRGTDGSNPVPSSRESANFRFLAPVSARHVLREPGRATGPVEQPDKFELVINLKTARAARPDRPALDPRPRRGGDRMRRRRVGEELKFCSVSPRVGNVKNKDPSLIETVLVQ